MSSESISTYDIYDLGTLANCEIFWRDHQKWLQSCGYMLRPRYSPDWVPSWKGTNKIQRHCEDGRVLFFKYAHVLDATRISDGAFVSLKRLRKSQHPYEVQIGKFLNSEQLVLDPRNHSVPILDILQVPGEQDMVIVVMPLLRRYNSPRFDTYGEIVGFFRQVFEGLQFMHEHLVAHRDCAGFNIMMDASSMYPEGYHPIDINYDRDFTGHVKHYTRTERPPKYYLIDFGISQMYKPEDMPPDEDVVRGIDRTAPEHQGDARTANPFPTDVYYIGNLVREDFLREMYGMEFMLPVVTDMVQDDPKKRPTMDEVVERFDVIVNRLSHWKLRSRVVYRKYLPIDDLFPDVPHWMRRIRFILNCVPPIPLPGSQQY